MGRQPCINVLSHVIPHERLLGVLHAFQLPSSGQLACNPHATAFQILWEGGRMLLSNNKVLAFDENLES
jgi:hypothetical protein